MMDLTVKCMKQIMTGPETIDFFGTSCKNGYRIFILVFFSEFSSFVGTPYAQGFQWVVNSH